MGIFSAKKLNSIIKRETMKLILLYLYMFRITSPFNKRKIKEINSTKQLLQQQQQQQQQQHVSNIPTPKKYFTNGCQSNLPVYQQQQQQQSNSVDTCSMSSCSSSNNNNNRVKNSQFLNFVSSESSCSGNLATTRT
jgi:hypothetical protein